MDPQPNGWRGALLCLAAIFLSSFLLVIGVLPFRDDLRGFRAVRSALTGVDAAVVGLLLAALYHPVWTSGILSSAISHWAWPHLRASFSGKFHPGWS